MHLTPSDQLILSSVRVHPTAADLEALGEEVRRRVLETSGVELRWEIRRVGEPLIQ